MGRIRYLLGPTVLLEKRTRTMLFRSILLIFLLTSFNAYGVDNIGNYVLGAGDKIKIHVFDEDDLSMDIIIGNSNTISYPFLGELSVEGLTAEQLANLISGKLRGDYLIKPEVTVSILEYRQFYVNGYVAKPGGFAFRPGITVRKAISLAGGMDERASDKKIYIVHGDQVNQEPVRIDLDTSIMPGDVITVGRSFF